MPPILGHRHTDDWRLMANHELWPVALLRFQLLSMLPVLDLLLVLSFDFLNGTFRHKLVHILILSQHLCAWWQFGSNRSHLPDHLRLASYLFGLLGLQSLPFALPLL